MFDSRAQTYLTFPISRAYVSLQAYSPESNVNQMRKEIVDLIERARGTRLAGSALAKQFEGAPETQGALEQAEKKLVI